jgi:DDE superfamily endonuclease
MTSCRGVTREHKGAMHTLAALKSIRASRPGGYRLFVILDNLAANKTPAIRRWARRENVELCLTPTNASWANPIEAHFGPLRTFVMGTSDHPNHPALARRLQALAVRTILRALSGRVARGSTVLIHAGGVPVR